MNYPEYLEQAGTTASEWETAVNTAAQELVDTLRKKCTYYDAKAALRKAESILELALQKAKV